MDRYVIALNITGHPDVPNDGDSVYSLAEWVVNQLEMGRANIIGVDIANDLPDNLCEPDEMSNEPHTIAEVYHYIPDDLLDNDNLTEYLQNSLKECAVNMEYDYTCGDESQVRVIGLSLVLPLDTTSMDDFEEIMVKLNNDAANRPTKNDNLI